MADDKPTLTRRRVLGGMATIGAAGAVGASSWAAFSDQENDISATFTAGAIDGKVDYTASYLNDQVGDGNGEYEDIAVANPTGTGVELMLTDVKPGDYGSITFNISLTENSNDAWVASCLGYDASENGLNDPEEAAGDSKDGGELQDNLLIIPFYSPNVENNFFDGNRQPNLNGYGHYGNGTSAAYWNSREGVDEFDELHPMTPREAVDVGEVATIDWSDGSPHYINAPQNSEAEKGCILLDGEIDPDQTEDATGVSPLHSGESLNFGYDWHLPYGTGNKAQTDTLTLKFGHGFYQVRHSGGPHARNVYAPENTNADVDGGTPTTQ